jgi:hypothetical protein
VTFVADVPSFLQRSLSSQDPEKLGDDFTKIRFTDSSLRAASEVPLHEDEAKVYRMFFLRVNSSAFIGLTDCTNENKMKGKANVDQ